MTAIDETVSPVRSGGADYQDLLDADTKDAPVVLRMRNPIAPGPTFVPVERYTSRAFHELEVEKLWKRVWQMACREEDIPEVGDHITYDIANLSVVVVRVAPDTIKAYQNICLHRGRLLKEKPGRDTELRCAFHGFAWNLDGSLKHVPCKWDFPQVDDSWKLPEVRVDSWGGFVFVSFDLDTGPLADHLGDLSTHFERWPLEKRYKQAHVAKVLRCNWKLAQEAFMEAYHVVATHPQLLAGIGDANSQYDVFGNFSSVGPSLRTARPARTSSGRPPSRTCSTRCSTAASTSRASWRCPPATRRGPRRATCAAERWPMRSEMSRPTS